MPKIAWCGAKYSHAKFRKLLASIAYLCYNDKASNVVRVTEVMSMSKPLEQWKYETKTRLPELLGELVSSIESVHPNCTVILYGSYARGEFHENSDLDICVLVDKLTYNRADMEIDAACTVGEDFPLPMDVSLYTYDEFEEKAKKKFLVQYDINREGVILGE